MVRERGRRHHAVMARRILSNLRRPRPAVLGWLVAALALQGSCGNGHLDIDEAEKDFSPLTDEEERALERMRLNIDAAAVLIDDARVPAEVRAELARAVADTRGALADFRTLRERGGARQETMHGIGVVTAGILGDDATGIGVADNVLLAGVFLVFVGTLIFTNSPATRDELGEAWYRVGERLDTLGNEVQAVAMILAEAAPLPAPAPGRTGDLTPDKLAKTPANTNSPAPPPGAGTTTTVTPVPVPVPAPKEEPPRERDECIPEPACPHRGQDEWHDQCADRVLGNRYPGCDVLVNGKHFDALAGRVLYEVKTDNWSSYAEVLKGWTLKAHDENARIEHALAMACGFEFTFVVADRALFEALGDKLKGTSIDLRYEPRCSRSSKP